MSTPQYYVVTTDTLVPAPTTLTGTVTSAGKTLTGSGTLFTTELSSGAWVWNAAQHQVRRVLTVNSDTELILDSSFSAELSAAALNVVTAEDAKAMHIKITNTGGLATTINNVAFASGASEEFGNKSNLSGDGTKFVRPLHVDGATSNCTVNLTMFSNAQQD